MEISQNNNKIKEDFSAIVGLLFRFVDEQEWGQSKGLCPLHESYCTCCYAIWFFFFSRKNLFRFIFILQLLTCVSCEIPSNTPVDNLKTMNFSTCFLLLQPFFFTRNACSDECYMQTSCCSPLFWCFLTLMFDFIPFLSISFSFSISSECRLCWPIFPNYNKNI